MKYLAIVALMLMIPAAVFAAPKNSANITFDAPVTVNGTQVPAGEYRVEWQGTGTSVQANILQGKKVVASAPATLINGKTQYQGAVETRKADNNSNILEAIDWSNRSLRFDQQNDGSTSSGSTTSTSE